MTQTKNVLQDIAVAAAVDSRARRFAHLSPHSLSLLSVLPTDADVRSRRRARALCGIGIFRESTRSLRQGRRKCCGEAGRPVGGGGRRCWRGRKGRPLSRSASCCCVALTPSLSTTTSGNSLSEKETHFSRTCEFKCRPGRFLCLWVQRLRWTEQTA